MNRSHSRRSFLKAFALAGVSAPFVTRGLMAQSPNGVLRHASFGAGGMAWADINEFARTREWRLVAVADVDLDQTLELRKKFPGARIYQDWRELLDREAKNIDSVNVSTPDHMHAPIAMSAMQLGKHVYGQKPLAHDLYEVRKMTEFARRKKLITQMGIQIHSSSVYRMGVLLIQANTIGRIKEVHSWCPKSWGDAAPLPNQSDPVPAKFDWDLWLGVCAERAFIGNAYYHPANWRKRLDFGTGTFGDMGCHIFDPVFKALELGYPESVRSEGPPPNQWNWALDSKIEYVFPGTRYTATDKLKVHWYDGAQKPPKDVVALLEGDPLPDTGSIFVGTQGAVVLPHIARPQLYPDKVFKDYKYPEMPGDDHWGSFIRACFGKANASANFDYSGPLTEAVLLGGVASRFPQTTLLWNGPALQFNDASANQYVKRLYRPGWQVKSLS